MNQLDISLLGHILNAISFLTVAIYVYHFRRELSRTTSRSSALFYFIITTSLLFAFFNLFRIGYEIAGGSPRRLADDIDLVAHYSSLVVQTAMIILLFTHKIVVQASSRQGRVLAIGAHPDDIEIAAGAALAKIRDAGYRVCGLVLTRGEGGGHAEVRPDEARHGAQFLGLDEVQLCDFNDMHLSEKAVQVTGVIEAMVAKVTPDLIFTHSYHDLHQDHQAVYEATLRATRNFRTTVLCYESPSVTQDFHPTYFIDVCNYVDVKIAAIREHWDQRNKPYVKLDVIRGKLLFRGGQAKVDYAEGFEVVRMISMI